MQYTTQTIARTIIGPYTGRRIAGSSSHVFDALATIEYRFKDFTVTVRDIPVRWDDEQQRQFISAQVGIDISRKLQDIEYAIERRRLTDRLEENKRRLAELHAEQERLEEDMHRTLLSVSNEPGEQPTNALLEEAIRSAIFNAPIRASLRAPEPLSPAA